MALPTLTRETALVQNPALGGVLIWRFCVSYAAEHRRSEAPPLPLAFLVLPITFHRGTFEELSSTRGSIHDRAMDYRELTMESIALAVKARLLTLVPATARLESISNAKPSALPTSVRPLAIGAEKIGKWFSGISMFEIENVLKVAF